MIAELIITVADVDEAVSFYTETVGLDYLRRVLVQDTLMVLLAAGTTRVALVAGPEPGIRIAFVTEDVAAAHRRLTRGRAPQIIDPTRAKDGTVLPFADPWGNPLAFWEAGT